MGFKVVWRATVRGASNLDDADGRKMSASDLQSHEENAPLGVTINVWLLFFSYLRDCRLPPFVFCET